MFHERKSKIVDPVYLWSPESSFGSYRAREIIYAATVYSYSFPPLIGSLPLRSRFRAVLALSPNPKCNGPMRGGNE